MTQYEIMQAAYQKKLLYVQRREQKKREKEQLFKILQREKKQLEKDKKRLQKLRDRHRQATKKISIVRGERREIKQKILKAQVAANRPRIAYIIKLDPNFTAQFVKKK